MGKKKNTTTVEEKVKDIRKDLGMDVEAEDSPFTVKYSLDDIIEEGKKKSNKKTSTKKDSKNSDDGKKETKSSKAKNESETKNDKKKKESKSSKIRIDSENKDGEKKRDHKSEKKASDDKKKESKKSDKGSKPILDVPVEEYSMLPNFLREIDRVFELGYYNSKEAH